MRRRPSTERTELGKALEELIEHSEFKTHAAFRAAADIGKSSLSQALNGVRPPKTSELRRWLAFFPGLSEKRKKELEALATYERALNDSDLREWAQQLMARLHRTESKAQSAEQRAKESEALARSIALQIRLLLEGLKKTPHRLGDDFMKQADALMSQLNAIVHGDHPSGDAT